MGTSPFSVRVLIYNQKSLFTWQINQRESNPKIKKLYKTVLKLFTQRGISKSFKYLKLAP